MQTFLHHSEEIPDKYKFKKFDFDVFLCSLLIFTLPITNFSIYILGSRIEPQRVLLILCVLRLITLLSLPSAKGIKRQKLAWLLFLPVLLTLAYAFLLTALQPDFIKNIRPTTDAEIYGFILKRSSKYLSYLALSVYLALVLRTKRKIYTILCSLAAALCIAEVLGLLQSLVFLISGVDLFPINRTNLAEGYAITNFTQSVTVNFLGLRFLRINSLANEPKALGIYITFLFFMKLYWSRYKQNYSLKLIQLINFYMCKTLLFSIVVILLTFSGSGLLAMIFGLLIATLINLKKIFYFRKDTLIYLTLATSVALLMPIFIETIPDQIDSFLQASLLRRSAQFLANTSIESFYASVDPEDGAILYNILNYPTVLISGLGFGAYSNLSLAYFSKYYSDGFSPFSRNILVETIFSVGIPGLILLSYFFYKINMQFIFKKNYFADIYLQLMLNHLVLINFFLRASEPIFFTAIGILTAVYLNISYNYSIQEIKVKSLI